MSPLAKLSEAFQNVMRPHVRSAFRPQVEPGDATGHPLAFGWECC